MLITKIEIYLDKQKRKNPEWNTFIREKDAEQEECLF